jgi:hypothetical protein
LFADLLPKTAIGLKVLWRHGTVFLAAFPSGAELGLAHGEHRLRYCLTRREKQYAKQDSSYPSFHRSSAQEAQCLNKAMHWQSYSQSIAALSMLDLEVKQIISGRIVFEFWLLDGSLFELMLHPFQN